MPVPVPVPELAGPSPQDAARLVELALGEQVLSVERFATGLAHYVYDVQTERRAVAARIARPEYPQSIGHAVAWSELLRPLGVPLPALLYADVDARYLPLPSMLLERLPGTDLGHCYEQLSSVQKREIARSVCQAQALVRQLPEGAGYGFVHGYQGPFPQATWRGVLDASLERSRLRIREAGVVAPHHVECVAELLPRFDVYLAAVPPRPFLDDTTTKNVIVHEGCFSGIVDVDALCFGDALFTVGLTRASLLNMGADLEYVDAWCQHLLLASAAYEVVELYTALFLVDFLSELGHRFNREHANVESERIRHLERLLGASLARLTADSPRGAIDP